MSTLSSASPRSELRLGAARPTASRKVQFAVATLADGADIQRLLRTNPMSGRIALTLEREPDYFRDAGLPGEQKETIVAREAGRLVCVGSCTTRLRFVNGQPRRVGYLAGLRLDASVAGRFDILRRGYEFFRESQASAPAEFYFTSIATDNERARRLLERGMPGMPRYEFLGEFCTLLLPVAHLVRSRGKPVCSTALTESGARLNALASRLNEHSRHFQLAPHWTGEQLDSLAPLGLRREHFHFVGTIEDGAFAALWDQRAFKQAVIRSYAPWLAWLRPILNLIARLGGRPRLPPLGSTLSHAFVSHVTVRSEQSDELAALIQELAACTDVEFLTFGFDATDPRLAVIRKRFSSREYRSRLYSVHWPGLNEPLLRSASRGLAPEVALL